MGWYHCPDSAKRVAVAGKEVPYCYGEPEKRPKNEIRRSREIRGIHAVAAPARREAG
jgi:hypothetical protein